MADISQIKLPSGDTFDIIDEKSGYITAQYIENKTDYSIPVSRVGEIVVGETAIGTDSTNFPTSKAVVDYVDERVVQEMDAIDVGVTGIKANGTSLSVVDGVVNIPIVSETQSVGLMTDEYMSQIYSQIRTTRNQIPTSTSQLTNDSGFITASDIVDEKVRSYDKSAQTNVNYDLMLSENTDGASTKYRDHGYLYYDRDSTTARLTIGAGSRSGIIRLINSNGVLTNLTSSATSSRTITLPNATGTVALTSDIPTIPTNISAFTNDSGYLTSSDIASVMSYKGTKANYAALPASGNTTGDVWHLTDTGAEWAWDGTEWQELGAAIDVSSFLTSETDPVFTASPAHGIAASDITNWNGKTTVSIVRW